MTIKKILTGILLLTLILTVTAGCSNDNSKSSSTSTLDKARKRGHFKIAVTSEAPPFGYIDENNKLVGFEIDLAKLINKLTFGEKSEVELVETSFDGRWAAVNNGQVDFGIMETSIYPDRLLNVAFTDPYIKSGNAILVKKDSKINTLEDLNNPDVTVALLTIPTDKERHETYYPKAKAQTFDSTASQIAAVRSGKADAAGIDLPAAQIAASKDDSLRVLPKLIGDPTNNAIFLKSNDYKLWLFLNTFVKELRHGNLQSQYDQIFEKWFGETQQEYFEKIGQ